MYCMACGKELQEGVDDIFLFKFEGKDPILAHACNRGDLPKEKQKKYDEFKDNPFCLDGRKYFGIVID